MPIPFDSKLKKLEILKRRAEAKHKATIEALEKAEYEAREEKFALVSQWYERCRELGYCGACESPLDECEGHAAMAFCW